MIDLTLAFVAGAGLGLLYFGGLWLTVRRLARARRPALLFLGSLVVRVAVLLGGLYLVMGEDWRRLLAALVGVIAARIVLTRRLGPLREKQQEVG